MATSGVGVDANVDTACGNVALGVYGAEAACAAVNVGGAGLVANAQNPENGIRFLEFLASDQAQEVLAERNYEFPVVEGVKKNPVLESWGDFAKDDINISILGENNPEAVRIFDRVGWR